MKEDIRHDLLVQSRFRNLILWDLMAGKSQADVARSIPVSQQWFGQLLNLRRSPLGSDGRYRPSAVKIAAYFGMVPEELFPISLYILDLPQTVERTYDSTKVLPLLAARSEVSLLPSPEDVMATEELRAAIGKVLRLLTPREHFMFEYWMAGESYAEIGERYGVGEERVRQIISKGLRKLRHRKRAKLLKPFLGIYSAVEPYKAAEQ